VTALYLSDFSIRGGKDPDFDRDVKWDVDLLTGYRSIFLGDRAQKRDTQGFWSLAAPRVWNELRLGRYEVLWLHGHNYAASLIALAAAKTVGMRMMMRSETHLGLPRHGVKLALRRPLMGALYGLCDRLLAIGSENAAFYRAMGVPEHKIFLVPYSVDNDRFIKAASLRPDQKVEVRGRYNVPTDRPSALYAAKFMRRKRPLDVLEAARRLKQRDQMSIHPGHGRFRRNGRRAARLLQGTSARQRRVYGIRQSNRAAASLCSVRHFCAAVGARALGARGERGDVRWPSGRGLVDGVNGFTPVVGDIEGLTTAFRRLIEDGELRRQQGQASLARISQWGFQQCLEGIRSALKGLEFRGIEPKLSVRANGGWTG
jgi:glycosyltransferase involved in cell wall biosynthesis